MFYFLSCYQFYEYDIKNMNGLFYSNTTTVIIIEVVSVGMLLFLNW